MVSPHVQPLQHRHPNDAVWHTGEVVHGQIQVLQFPQVPQLMMGTQSRPQVRGQVQALIWELVCVAFHPLLFRLHSFSCVQRRVVGSPGLGAGGGLGSWPAPVSPDSDSSTVLRERAGSCCSSAAAP